MRVSIKPSFQLRLSIKSGKIITCFVAACSRILPLSEMEGFFMVGGRVKNRKFHIIQQTGPYTTSQTFNYLHLIGSFKTDASHVHG